LRITLDLKSPSAQQVLEPPKIRLIGFGPFLFVHLPIMLFAGLVGVWLFYVQHQFESTFWAHDASRHFKRRPCTEARIMTYR
jgi:fatty acid desaturase